MQPGAALFDCRDSLIDDSKGLILCRANPLPDFRQESSVFRRGGLRPFHGALRGHRLLPHPLRHAASPPTSIHTGRCAACGGFHPFVTGSPTPSCWWYYSRGGAQAHAEEAPPTVGSPCGFWGKVYCANRTTCGSLKLEELGDGSSDWLTSGIREQPRPPSPNAARLRLKV